MCGIVGICLAARWNGLGEALYRGLQRLEYRGYDSAGIAVVDEKKLVVLKGKGRLQQLEQKLGFTKVSGVVGVGHTRWATHGAPSDENAHPHLDCSGRFAIVHNGIIENYYELKEQLLEKGHVFRSETDTEVVVHLVEELYEIYKDVYTAFKEAVKKLKGAYALLLISVIEPDKIFFAKKDSPLVLGLGDGYNLVASDVPALLDHTRRVVVLRDYWVGYITPRKVYIEDLLTGSRIDYANYVRIVEWSIEEASKEGYEHYMLKEIHEQPRALSQTLAGLRSDKSLAEEVVRVLREAATIYVTGAGTSYHAAEFFALSARTLAGIPVFPFIASEYEAFATSAKEGDVLIAVSQSGETMDVLKAVRSFKKQGAKIVAISNVIDSAIPRESDLAIYTRAGPEIGVAATKTFTTQVLTLSWILMELLSSEGLSRDELKELKESLESSAKLVEESIRRGEKASCELANVLASAKSMYYLSRSIGVPVAKEGALKIKEVAYIHAEAYPAGESKHGPIALIEPGFPVVFVVPAIPRLEKLIAGNVEEMKSRGAFTIGVIPQESALASLFDYVIEVPRSHWIITPITHTPPLQLLAYYVAVKRGADPDKPRNLAKTVTVE